MFNVHGLLNEKALNIETYYWQKKSYLSPLNVMQGFCLKVQLGFSEVTGAVFFVLSFLIQQAGLI